MNVFSILFGLLFAAYAVLVLVLAIVAACFGRWLAAGGIVAGGAALYVGGMWALSLGDPLVSKPVPKAQLAATYRLSPATLKELRAGSYDLPNGELILKADGTFTGTRIPACCVHGDYNVAPPSFEGCYTLAGTWKAGDGGDVGVDLTVASGKLTEVDPETPKITLGNWEPPSKLHLDVFRGPPYELGFSVFDGADFIYLFFSQPASASASAGAAAAGKDPK